MEVHTPVMDHPKKRRRRRRIDRLPLHATLLPDPHLRHDEALLSNALYDRLFPGQRTREEQSAGSEVQYIVVSSWAPEVQDPYRSRSWTILPIKSSSSVVEGGGESEAPTIRYPASSPKLRAFLGDAHPNTTSRSHAGGKLGTRILVLDVEPVKLTTVYVSVDGNALEKHEKIQKEFGGGFGSFRKNSHTNKGKGKETLRHGVNGVSGGSTQEQLEEELIATVRSALGSSTIVRQEDLLQLPLPTHPITHVPLPPAKILLCEPVRQGLLTSDTQIIVDRHFASGKKASYREKNILWSSPQSDFMENGEDTSNEQFYSAVEDGVNGHMSQEEQEGEMSSPRTSPESGNSSESDESADGIISLSTPDLPTRSFGNLSSVSAIPRPQHMRSSGTSTPGSVFSSLTATTARGLPGIAKSFHACSLLAPIPDDLLHPKPDASEDDEARVYVDIKDLLRLKCFSGDWIKIRVNYNRRHEETYDWTMSASHTVGDVDNDGDIRVVKIFGLSDVSPRRVQRYRLKDQRSVERSSSVASCSQHERIIPKVWLSPILFANLGSPIEVRIAPLSQHEIGQRPYSPKTGPSKKAPHMYPPIAVEVSLAKISTPISQESAMQESLFARLKQYFESKRRIVKTGDLIALTLNVTAGRLLGSKPTAENDKETEELLSLIQDLPRLDNRSMSEVWIRVGQITARSPGKEASDLDESIWGGAVCVKPSTTRMTIGTSHQCKIPSTSSNPWKSYLGLVPKSPVSTSAGPLGPYMSMTPQPYVSTLNRRLRELIAAATSLRAAHLGLEPTLILLHSNQRSIGKATVATRAASDLGIHTFSIEAYDIVTKGNAGDVQDSSINTRMARGLSCGAQHTLFLIKHLEALTSNRLMAALERNAKSARVLIATTCSLDQLPENLRSLFTHEIEMSAPDEKEREGILRNIIQEQGIRTAQDVDLTAIAVKTAALVAGNLLDIVERACIAREQRLAKLIETVSDAQSQPLVRDLVVSGGEWACCVTKADFDLAVDAARKNFADAIGAPKIPNVSWDDVGGLDYVKDAVMETIQLPLERPELFAKGMKKRSGILFYGPPGTGKTLLAKAIATEFSLNFFSVKGPELLNMYIGESEANVRRVFQRARDARPCVVFFDELDSVAPKRGNQGDSGGVMDRIVSQLLAELDGMSDGRDGGGGVFVIGATNRPDLLDQALLRPGRFDKMLYLGISDTHQKQLTILEALSRKFTLDSDLSLARVAESLPFTYTGADLYALCSDAMLKAITRQASAVDAKIKALPNGPVSHAYFFDHLATKEDIAVTVSEEDFQAARRELVGSVSAKELEHYQRVRQSFEAPTKPPSISPVPNVLPQRSMPTRPKPNRRTNTAIKAQPIASVNNVNGKGKGKAIQMSDSDHDDDDDDAYVTSNDFAEKTPEKGKGKQRATMIPKPVYGFGDGVVDGDDDVYS